MRLSDWPKGSQSVFSSDSSFLSVPSGHRLFVCWLNAEVLAWGWWGAVGGGAEQRREGMGKDA